MSVQTKLPSRRSSSGYAAELAPQASARRAVLVAGWLALVSGLVMLMHLELSILVKVALSAAWLTDLGLSLGRQARVQRRIKCLTVPSEGPWSARCIDGKTVELQVLRGSVLTQRWAWFRLRLNDGQVYGELLSRSGVEREAWRRLQVAWRWGRRAQ